MADKPQIYLINEDYRDQVIRSNDFKRIRVVVVPENVDSEQAWIDEHPYAGMSLQDYLTVIKAL